MRTLPEVTKAIRTIYDKYHDRLMDNFADIDLTDSIYDEFEAEVRSVIPDEELQLRRDQKKRMDERHKEIQKQFKRCTISKKQKREMEYQLVQESIKELHGIDKP